MKNIIFDFGDIFIDLDKGATARSLEQLGLETFPSEMIELFVDYECGRVPTDLFLAQLQQLLPGASRTEIIHSWNSILLDIPQARFDFLVELTQMGRHRLFLLSNTNELHIRSVSDRMGVESFHRFRSCFEAFYLSYELGMRKPDLEIFEFVLAAHELNPAETLFIDDTQENTLAAAQLGIQTWHLQVGEEDVTELKHRLQK